MTWIATLSQVKMDGSVIVLSISFQEGAKILTKELRYNVRDRDLTLQKILKQVQAIRTSLEEKSALFVQLKAREGQQL